MLPTGFQFLALRLTILEQISKLSSIGEMLLIFLTTRGLTVVLTISFGCKKKMLEVKKTLTYQSLASIMLAKIFVLILPSRLKWVAMKSFMKQGSLVTRAELISHLLLLS